MNLRTTFPGLGLLAAALLGAGCRDSISSERRAAPAFAAMDTIQIVGQDLYVSSGFNVNLFAEGQDGVRSLALGPSGAVFATLSGGGQIVRLVDEDGDGVAESISTVLSGLDYPFGLAFRGDTMYFAERTTVKRRVPGGTPVTLVSGIPSGGHTSRTIVFGPDNRLYLSAGSSCDVCGWDTPPRAAVTRYNLDGSNPHTFATGLRNSVGLAFHPTTGELWANNNDRDNLGDDQPPERLNILRDGRWYGWPQCYLPGQPNPEFLGADCSGVEPPAITFQAHAAPLGLVFYTGGTFPAEYQGDAFMTYHGSWNRSVPVEPKVVRVRVQNGRPMAIEDFVTGWQLPDGSRWGRPVGLLEMPDGALLVSDDDGGRIWRVSVGAVPPPPIGTGDLDVTTVTTGSNLDPDDYLAVVDGTTERAMEKNATIRISDLAAGDHTVDLDGVAPNCTVTAPDPRTVTITGGLVTSTTFSVRCN
jgi:glucose/arabinose dehydrogenase